MKTKVSTMRATGVNFMHFRKLGEDGKPLPYGGMTVAYKVLADGSVIVAESKCRNDSETGMRDNFNRKVGAAIAGGRVLAYENSHGANECARLIHPADLKLWREAIATAINEAYGLVRDFQAKPLPASQAGLVSVHTVDISIGGEA